MKIDAPQYQLFRLFLQMCELTFNLSKELILCRLPFKVNNF
jgi:hypothetical protein